MEASIRIDWKTLSRKLKIAQGKVLSKLCLFALLVLDGIKPAYLVDTCFLTTAQANALLDDLCKAAGYDRLSVKAMEVGSDIFLINERLVRDRLLSMTMAVSSSGLRGVCPFAVIRLDRDASSSAITDDDMETFPGDVCEASFAASLSAFHQLLTASLPGESLNISTDANIYHALGGPTIAGILLGYPCIYKATPLTGPDADDTDACQLYAYASRKLSYRILKKVIVTATIAARDPFLSQWSPTGRGSMAVPLYEFTAPVLASSSSSAAAIDRVIDQFYDALMTNVVIGDRTMISLGEWQRSDELWEAEGVTL